MKKILIVDDNPVSLMTTDNMLAGHYQTVCAVSAEQALELCNKGAPDLLLCNVHLPDMTGAELHKTLQEKTGAEFPLIIVTADDDSDAQNLDGAAAAVVQSPFDQKNLLRHVAAALQSTQQASAMKKILIVDDMIVPLMMTENMLADKYETFCATSAKEAMEIYRKEMPDMILSDFRMPGMTGYEMQIALQNEFHKKIPFMFMTADETDEVESRGFDNGAMDLIHKPFEPKILLRRVANILQTVGEIQDLKKTSTTDALTGLFNKAASEEELAKICKRSVGSLMMIDLDSFKLVNDIHGHAMGDKILIAFADILRAAFRSSDLIGRMGGDEFVAFCDGVQEETAISLKTQFINEKITAAAKKLMGEDMNIPLGASIGCVLVPNSGTNFAELYKMADKALYTVKQNGKHGYSIFSEDAPEEEVETVVTLAQIEMILGERNKERGAYVLPVESFRIVYRFLKRTRGGYGKTICILLFSLKRKGDDEKISLKDASEQFLDCMHETLRRGDVITKNGRNQFIALLTNTDGHHDVTGAVGRLAEAWSKFAASKNFYFSHEWEVMDS